jgi:hypothetical protein
MTIHRRRPVFRFLPPIEEHKGARVRLYMPDTKRELICAEAEVAFIAYVTRNFGFVLRGKVER